MKQETAKEGPFRIRPLIKNGTPSSQWQLDVPSHMGRDGKRRRLSFNTKREAVNEARRRLRVFQQPDRGGAQNGRSVGMALSEAASSWCEYEEARIASGEKSASTLEPDIYRLKAILGFMGNEDIGRIDRKRIEEFKAHRLQNGRKKRTINSDLGTLRSILKWACAEGYLIGVPAVKQYHIQAAEIDLPTLPELVRMVEALPARVRPFVQLIIETGCRRSEARHLVWKHVDLKNGIVRIAPVEDFWTPKNQYSIREIRIGSKLVRLISDLPRRSAFVFPGRKDPNKPLDNCRKSLATAVKKAGVFRDGKPMKIGLHMFRKVYATHLAMQGVDESVLQRLIGHAKGSRVTRQFYIQADKQALLETVFELPFEEQDENESQGTLAIFGNDR